MSEFMDNMPNNQHAMQMIQGNKRMMGAGIFVLIGQIAELVGNLFPIAFIAGSLVVGFSSYSYVKLSSVFPSSVDVVKFLNKSNGSGNITNVCKINDNLKIF